MPCIGEVVALVLLLLDEHDFGMPAHPFQIWMHDQRTETPAEQLVLFRREVLSAKEDDLMVDKGAMNLFERVFAQLA